MSQPLQSIRSRRRTEPLEQLQELQMVSKNFDDLLDIIKIKYNLSRWDLFGEQYIRYDQMKVNDVKSLI